MNLTEAASAPDTDTGLSTLSRLLPWLRTVVRVGLGVVWIVAGGMKVLDPGQSVVAVKAYEVLPHALATVVGLGLPYAEVLLGLALIAGFFTRWSAIASGGLQLVFIVGLIQAWARGLTIDCGCFSSGGQVDASETTYPLDLARDTVFLLGAVWLIVRPYTKLAVDSFLGLTPALAGVADERDSDDDFGDDSDGVATDDVTTKEQA